MDYIGRMLGRKMAPTLGQQLVIDNRPGAGGALGTDIVAKSPPDGYTILHTSSSHAVLPMTTKSLPYDAVKDFVPVGSTSAEFMKTIVQEIDMNRRLTAKISLVPE
ncbi:MAG: tripartite tricarboxylate transporter substrate-binding protein [Dehalococcoidia bacterium]|nr:tripartite tricarboxylate transporter substrate-binding protein [Dehalococcoidia bacterium]